MRSTSNVYYYCWILYCLLCTVGDVQGQQCPNNANTRTFAGSQTYAAPLSAPVICLGCCFLTGVPTCDVVWSLNGNNLTNGDMNGSVIIENIGSSVVFKLPDPDNVLNVGDIVSCSSPSWGQHSITITEFSKLNYNILYCCILFLFI